MNSIRKRQILLILYVMKTQNKVQRRLKNYLGEKVKIEILPELSDLGHTIYFGLKDAVGTVIINFADTIVLDSVYRNRGKCFFLPGRLYV